MAKTPRTKPFDKLTKRLYEAVYLLYLLGKTQDESKRTHYNPNDPTAVRRRYLRNLAHLCDLDGGGISVAAIAVEDLDDCNKFWLALNSTVETPQGQPSVAEFLTMVLDVLVKYPWETAKQKELTQARLLRQYVSFAARRIRKEVKFIRNPMSKCIQYLQDNVARFPGEDTSKLILWMEKFVEQPVDKAVLCIEAYNQRKTPQMAIMNKLGRAPAGSNSGEVADNFRKAERAILRLVNHVRVVKQLCEDAGSVERLLESHRVELLTPPQPLPQPTADALTEFDSIVKRMIQPSDPQGLRRRQALAKANDCLSLEEKMLELYRQGKEPRVHAEVQLLEHFYLGNGECRPFAYGDKYIACSKRACFCCKLYFANHPAECVEPDTHNNVWPQWSPMLARPEEDEQNFLERRAVLNGMIRKLRETIFGRVMHQGSFPGTHRDTVTARTDSVNGVSDEETLGYDSISELGMTSSETIEETGDEGESSDEELGGAAI